MKLSKGRTPSPFPSRSPPSTKAFFPPVLKVLGLFSSCREEFTSGRVMSETRSEEWKPSSIDAIYYAPAVRAGPPSKILISLTREISQSFDQVWT